MSVKERFKRMRDGLQQGIYFIINPFVRMMIKIGVTPNMVTFAGMLGQVLAAVVMVYAALNGRDGSPDYALVTLSGVLTIAFSVFDMLDGQVARLGNMASKFGAMFDSVLDRYCEMAILGGILFYLMLDAITSTLAFVGAVATFVAIVGSIMVSYTRARAEGIGIECKIGFMQRPERVVITAAALLATGIVGQNLSPESTFDPNWILTVAMGIIAVFSNMTAAARLGFVKKRLSEQSEK
ncbi:MAG: CDP-alcohol phosphatidyltransferase family protein [Muribaculaceae bacterium]|nr:CDP-alcohol phosphatidyltransferase family protein [Muribaculaceae bacterium]